MSFNNVIKILIVFLITFFYLTKSFGQNEEFISDFYEYANRDWLNITPIPQNVSVVNNWGILWNEIIDKSIEILSGETKYELDNSHQYILIQLQNFYKSTVEYSGDERKRVELIQKHYPMLFGVIFSKITIPYKKEEKIKELIKYLTISYRTKLENSDKIDKKNIKIFLSKLDNMEFEIGSPNISNIQIMPKLSVNSLKKNIQLSEEYQLEISRDKPDWVSPPFETDCRYNLSYNKVKIYAGTLYAYDFINEEYFVGLFATIGRTIAHEMTHAFDKSKKNFNKKDLKNITQSLISQFNQYAIQDKYFVDGEKTLQENFADLGGLEVSLLALKLFIKDNYPQYSEDEKSKAISSFFISYAQFWREKATPEFEILSLKRLHTPQKFRAIGPIYNQNELYEFFEIDKESKYYIHKNLRISIW